MAIHQAPTPATVAPPRTLPDGAAAFIKDASYGQLLYHGTPAGNVESILRNGLEPRAQSEYLGMPIEARPQVFLTNDPAVAARHGTVLSVAVALDRPLVQEPGEGLGAALARAGADSIAGFDGVVRKGSPGWPDIITAFEAEDLRVLPPSA